MTRSRYINFCNKYDINPDDFDAVLEVIDFLEGDFGDKSGELQEIREYVYDKVGNFYEKDTNKDMSASERVNVYQVKDGLTRDYAFMSYDYIKKRYGGIDLNNYSKVASVVIPESLNENIDNILNYVFNYGNSNQQFYADNPKARSISVSDILEYKLVKYYVDSTGFVNLDEEGKLTEGKEISPANLKDSIIAVAKDLGLTVDRSGKEWVIKDGNIDVLYLTPRRTKYNYMDRLKIYTVENPSEKAKKLYNVLKTKGLLEEGKELLAEEGENEPPFIEKDDEEIPVEDLPETDEDKTLIDYLQDRIGQQITVAEFNTVLQSLFSRYNDIFIIESDLYNADLDENQELVINDDMEDYVINYDIIDVEAGIIEITDVNVE